MSWIEIGLSLIFIAIMARVGYKVVDKDPDVDENEWIAAGLFALLGVGVTYVFWTLVNGIAGILVDKWWFDTTGYGFVWAKQFGTKITLWIAGFVITLLALLGSQSVTYRLVPFELPENRKLAGYAKWVGLVVALIVGLIMAGWMSDHWSDYLTFAYQQAFGKTDPVFGKDISFFVFSLPFYSALLTWLYWLVAFTVVFTIGHYVHLFIQADSHNVDENRWIAGALRQGNFLLGCLFLLFGAGRFLSRYWLEVSGSNPKRLPGASVVDIVWNMRLAALFAVVLWALAGVFFYRAIVLYKGKTATVAPRARSGSRTPPAAPQISTGALLSHGIIVAGALILSLLAMLILPYVYYRGWVRNVEATKEAPYITASINGTYDAYGLTGMTTQEFTGTTALQGQEVQPLNDVLEQMRVQDWRTVLQVNNSNEYVKQPYHFADTDVDRYGSQQVYSSLRDADLSHLPDSAKGSWVNDHLQYTHGYGYTIAATNQIAGDGSPVYLARGVPLQGPPEMMVKRPEIYFGEYSGQYVVVKTNQPELSLVAKYPGYEGNAGIPMTGFNRLVVALAWDDYSLWVAPDITSNSLLLFRRTPVDRITTIAPFLTLDPDPFPVFGGDEILIVNDGFTTSHSYPYSDGGFYVRNSVKAVQGAYSGHVDLYQFDAADPIANTWNAAMPGLLKPAAQIPQLVVPHLRYPENMYRKQAAVLERYHITDPGQFYNGSGQWALDNELYGIDLAVEPIEPRYIEYRLPEDADRDFYLAIPFTTVPGDDKVIPNLAGWLAGKADVTGNKLVMFTFPNEQAIPGSLKVDNAINTVFSRDLTLYNGSGSKVYWGNTVSFPVQGASGNRSILYIKPLYVQGSFQGKQGIPNLTRVFVILNNKIADGRTLNEALGNLYAGRFRASLDQAAQGTAAPAAGQPLPPASAPVSGTTTVSGTIDLNGLTPAEADAVRQLVEALKKAHGR